MKKFSISVLGRDRPGIIAAVTEMLVTRDCNIEGVSQTRLQGEFSSIFIVTGPDQSDPAALSRELQEATRQMEMHFHVRSLVDEPVSWTDDAACESYVITTFGPDRKGLVAEVTRLLADFNVNVTRLQAVFRGGDAPDRNFMIYEMEIPDETDQKGLRRALGERCRGLNLALSIQHKKVFEAVNRL